MERPNMWLPHNTPPPPQIPYIFNPLGHWMGMHNFLFWLFYRVIFDLYGGWESRFLTFSKLHRGCLEGIHCIQPMLSIAHRWGVCDLLGQRLQLSYSSTGWYVPQALNRSNPFIISVLKQIEWCHHDPLHEIHAHRKLLDLEGWEN